MPRRLPIAAPISRFRLTVLKLPLKQDNTRPNQRTNSCILRPGEPERLNEIARN